MRFGILLPVCLSLLLGVACGKKDKDDSSKAAGPGQDWSGKPLKATEAALEGVKLTLQLPGGMKLSENHPDRKEWRADLDDYFSEPSVRVMIITTAPKTLEEATKHYMVDEKNVIARKEALNGGLLVTHHTKNKGLLYAVFFKSAGAKNLVCSASQAKQGGVPNFEKTRAWLERICLSMTPK